MDPEEMKRRHEQGFDLTYEEQGDLIEYAIETENWIAAGEQPPWQSLMGRDVL